MASNIFIARTAGIDKPTVILASGTGFPVNAWFESGVATMMVKTHRVFAYNRKHTFNSSPGQINFMPNTAKEVVNNLRQLLKQTGLKPPYTLVGRSFGGLYMM